MISIRRSALADAIRENELRIPIQRNPCVLIAGDGVVTFHMLLLAVHERPNFVSLDLLGSDIADSGIKNGTAAFASQFETAKNGPLIHRCKPSRGVDSNAFGQQFDDAGKLFDGDAHFVERLALFITEGA